MGMDKYGCFIQMYAYYYWIHSQQSMKTRHVSKVIDVFQRMCSYLKKKKCQVPISSVSLHWAIYSQTCLHFCRTLQLNFCWTCKMYIYYYICFPLCAHILYLDDYILFSVTWGHKILCKIHTHWLDIYFLQLLITHCFFVVSEVIQLPYSNDYSTFFSHAGIIMKKLDYEC